MKRLVVTTLMAVALLGVHEASASAESTADEIRRLEKESYAAIIASDYPKMRVLMADDWVQQDNSDDPITRELMIERLKSGDLHARLGKLRADVGRRVP